MKKSKSKFSKYLNGGDPKKPIIVNDPNDPRLQAYQDSLSLYNNYKQKDERYSKYAKEFNLKTWKDNNAYVEGQPIQPISTQGFLFPSSTKLNKHGFSTLATTNDNKLAEIPNQLYEEAFNTTKNGTQTSFLHGYKKPTQPVEYQAKNSISIGSVTNSLGESFPKSFMKRKDENISKLKTKDIGLVNSNTNKAKALPVNKTKFNTDSNYSITSGIGKTNTTYFPDEELLNEAVTNLRIKYPKSVQSQKSKGTANYDFPGATNDEVMKFKNGGKLRKMPDGGIIKPPIQTTDPNKVRAYNDSLQLHNLTKGIYDGMLGDMKNGVLPAEKVPYHINKMDEIIPKTDSLVNDLYDMGINYKVKGYNKVPIGSNGNFTEIGKLQKVAPAPKQPYFFKQGGKLPNNGKLSYGGSIGTGAASGAAMGATIGSIIPVWGTAAGAVIGGVAGGVGGYFKEKNQQESLERQEDLNTNLSPNFNMNPLGNSFKNGGYLPDQEYDLSEAEIEKLIRKGYKIKRLQ